MDSNLKSQRIDKKYILIESKALKKSAKIENFN